MAIRALIGFDHLEGLTTWPTFLDHGLTYNAATSSIATTGGFVGANTATTNGYQLTMAIGNLIDPAATKYVIGMRLKCYQAGDAAHADAAVGPGFGTLPYIDGGGGAYAVLAAVNSQAYVEYEVDLVSGTVKRWVNNQPTTDVAISPAVAKSFRLGCGYSYYSPYRMSVKDIYIVDNVATPDDANVSRLGPQVLVPIVGSAAVGPNWTNTGASLLAALNPAEAEAPNTNKATSPLSREALTLSLAATIPTGAKINGVELNMGGKSLTSSPTLMATKLVQGGSEKAGKTPSVPLVQNYNQLIGLFPKAPDGNAWSSANLNATNLVITPDVAG